jgi:gliding motility-associated-like protein
LADTIRVNVGNSINVIATASSDSICVGENVILTAQNGSNHTWNSDPSLISTSGTTVSATPTVNTTYTVTGGSGLCSDTGIVKVVVLSSSVSISSPQSLICKNSSITLTASGANSYSWSNGQTTPTITVSPTSSTSYTLTGDGGGGLCPSIAIKTITVDTSRIEINGLTNVCDGQASNLTANSGNNFSWSTGQNGLSISPIINGDTTIYLYGNNINGCLDTNSLFITTSPKPIVTISGNDSICSGTTTLLTASGANIYSWQSSSTFTSNNTQNVSPTVNTSYIVYGDLNGCISSDTILIRVLASPNITGSANYNLCIGSSANIQLNGSPNYTWQPTTGLIFNNDSNATVTPSNSTTYTIIGGINTCKDTFTVNINVDVNPVTISVITSEDSLCSNQSASITASGATTYLWSPSSGLNNINSNSVIATPSSNITYTVIGTNTFCKDTSFISLNVLNTPTVSATPQNASICSGKSVTLNSNGNATSYSWLPSASLNNITGTSVIANPTTNTIYTVIGFNGNCSDSAFVNISVSNNINISSNISNSTICSGTNTSLNVTGASNYSWIPSTGINNPSSGNVIASPLTNTNYTVVGYNTGCSDTVYINVSVLPALNLNVNASNTNICKGDNTTLNASSNGSGNTYSWFPNVNLSNTNSPNTIASPIASQLYTVIATNGQCFDTASIYIQVLSGITTAISASPSAVCVGNSSTLTASGALNYSWTNNGANTASISVSPLTTTTYTAIGFNGSCIDTAFFNLIINPLPTISTVPDQSIAIGSSVSLIASGGVSYIWTPAENLSCISCPNPDASPQVTTTYLVVGTDSKGCTGSATVTVKVDDNYVIYIPTAFSPNNDGENDILYVRGRGISEMNIVIFNGWGEKVFESDSQLVGWDGTRNGAELNSGVFVYQLNGKYYNGKEFTQKGDITLMK